MRHLLLWLSILTVQGCIVQTEPVSGEPGATGSQGPAGEPGMPGATGPTGPAGASPFTVSDGNALYTDGNLFVGPGLPLEPATDFGKRQIMVSGGTSGDAPSVVVLQGSRTVQSSFGAIVGIHQTLPVASIDFLRDNADGAGAITLTTRPSSDSDFNLGIWISRGGKVGIGVGDPVYRLDVGACNANECARKPDGGSWTSPSDIRLKKNVQSIEHPLATLLRLHGVTFQWKNPEQHANLDGPQLGMIAQEVEEAFPDWVSTDTRGYKAVTIRGFEALAVESIRELKAENEVLRTRNQDLQDQLSAQSRQLGELQSKVAQLQGAIAAIEKRLGQIDQHSEKKSNNRSRPTPREQ